MEPRPLPPNLTPEQVAAVRALEIVAGVLKATAPKPLASQTKAR